MVNSERDMAAAAAWLLAVVGAGALMIAPITSWMVPVEVFGAVTCLVAIAILALRFVRR
jgi:hypothetical protein